MSFVFKFESTLSGEVLLLHAVYDLRCSPITFDFCNYLAISYMISKVNKSDKMNLVIRADSFRNMTPREKAYTMEDRNWRVGNLLLEVSKCCFIVQNISVLRDNALQEVVIKNMVPLGYDPIRRIGVPYLLAQVKKAFAHSGIHPLLFRPSPSAVAMVDRLIGQKPFITLTLRQASFDKSRNCDLVAWAEAAREFSSSHGINVFLLPDQDDVLADRQAFSFDWSILEFTGFSLDLRLAVMSRAVQNFVSSGGMAAPLWYSNLRYVMFNIVHDGHYVADLNYLRNSAGLSPGDSLAWATSGQVFEWERLSPRQLLEKYCCR